MGESKHASFARRELWIFTPTEEKCTEQICKQTAHLPSPCLSPAVYMHICILPVLRTIKHPPIPPSSNPNSWEWPGFLYKPQPTHKPVHYHSYHRLHPFLTLPLASQVKKLQRLESAFRSWKTWQSWAGVFTSMLNIILSSVQSFSSSSVQAAKAGFFWMHRDTVGTLA